MIPKIVWQTHESKYEDLPELYKINSQTYQTIGWEYRYHSALDRQLFISEHFPEYLHLYLHIGPGIYRADFWRYLVLYKHGGFYTDMDSRLAEYRQDSDFARSINDPESTFNVLKDTDTYYANGTIICSQDNLIMKEIVEAVVSKCQEFYDEGWKVFPHPTWVHATGPKVYTEVIQKHMDKVSHWYTITEGLDKFSIQHGGRHKHKMDIDSANNMFLGQRY